MLLLNSLRITCSTGVIHLFYLQRGLLFYTYPNSGLSFEVQGILKLSDSDLKLERGVNYSKTFKGYLFENKLLRE